MDVCDTAGGPAMSAVEGYSAAGRQAGTPVAPATMVIEIAAVTVLAVALVAEAWVCVP